MGNLSERKGRIGELLVKYKLNKLSKEEYRVLNNIMIEVDDKTYQIDHIVISKYGIFVIETKSFRGFIIGVEGCDKWMQFVGKKAYEFPNPIQQNYWHIHALKKLLELDENIFIPIICFTSQVKLKVDSKQRVIKLSRLNSNILGQQNVVLDVDLDEIYNKITSSNIINKQELKKHVKNIKTRLKIDNIKIDNIICPNCGGELGVKKGKKNKPFIGCSNYPNCKFTKRI